MVFWVLFLGFLTKTAAFSLSVGILQLSFSATKVQYSAIGSRGGVLNGRLGVNIAQPDQWSRCEAKGHDEMCIRFANTSTLKLFKIDVSPQTTCTRLMWETANLSDVLTDCMDIDDNHWYGGPEQYNQSWPLETVNRENMAYVSGDMLQDGNKYFGGSLERYWLSSKGIAIKAGDDFPLFITINKVANKFCFTSKMRPPYATPANASRTLLLLNYKICTGRNAKLTHQDYVKWKGSDRRPKTIPDEKVIRYPIWSTWAQYHTNINETNVLEFARNVRRHGFSASQIEVDDKWETCYGEFKFDPKKFPKPKAMTEAVQTLGFKVTLWVHPFINLNCPLHAEAKKKGFFVMTNKSEAGITKWWNGNASIIDFSNDAAVQWWKGRLIKLQEETGINSFKFDAGEGYYLPKNFVFHSNPDDVIHPDYFSKKYVEAVSSFGRDVEVRVSGNSYPCPVFLRMLDKDSRWGSNNGLKTLIPTALTFGLNGYPFVLPDMIGGNAYDADKQPSKELFIRWLAATIFLPAVQFSIVPWNYDEETVKISIKFMALRDQYMDSILSEYKDAQETGLPIIRPVWWGAPDDPQSYTVDSEFMMGDKLLVAPVLEPGAKMRDVYIPLGQWRDPEKLTVFSGPGWVRNFTAGLEDIPHFEKIS